VNCELPSAQSWCNEQVSKQHKPCKLSISPGSNVRARFASKSDLLPHGSVALQHGMPQPPYAPHVRAWGLGPNKRSEPDGGELCHLRAHHVEPVHF
jgi:hypothetical protein